MQTTRAPQATGTAISRRLLVIAALAVGCTGCGGHGGGSFAWFHSQSAPADWPVARIPSGAAMPYPPGWRRVAGDPGTASAALLAAGGRFLGYLNVTPQQGHETLRNWRSFRIEHNAEEGDRGVKQLAAATGLRFGDGRGSCVQDSYTTETGGHYIEIACLVAGPNTGSVIIGAARPDSWPRVSGSIKRAIEGFRA